MRRRTHLLAATCLTLVLASAAGSARAQTNYLTLRLAGISGSSTVLGHSKDIDISSYAWGVALPISSSGQTGAPSFADLSVTKALDKTSPTLAYDCASATALSAATVFITQPNYSTNYDAYKIQLNNVVISSVQSTAPNGTPAETLTLHYHSISWTYTPLDPTTGAPGAPVTTSYTVP